MSNARRLTLEAIGLALILAAGFIGSGIARTDSATVAPVPATVPATVAPAATVPDIECDTWGGTVVTCVDGWTGTEYAPVPHCEIVSTSPDMLAAADYIGGEWWAENGDGPFIGAATAEDGIIYRHVGTVDGSAVDAAHACAVASPLTHE